MTKILAALMLAALPLALWAQNEEPAVNTEDQPAVSTDQIAPARRLPPAPAAEAETVHKADRGTTVVGEQEAPIGLYITPWRNSSAAGGLDRPARLLDESLMPLDPDEFSRRVNYNRALTEHLQKSGRATP